MRPVASLTALATLALPALLAGTARAQTNSYLYSPKDHASVEGDYFSYLFGAFPSARYQLIDGENRGTSAQLKDVAFRLDHRSHTSTTTAIGRTWSNVSLTMAEGDLSKVTNVFSKNTTTTPTKVFSGTVTWPDFSGTPLTRPDVWGGSTGAYRMPFSSAWSYSGKQDIVSDFDFTGGQLANKSPWTAVLKGYWLDSYQDPGEPRIGTYRTVPRQRLNNNSAGVTDRCNDSFFGNQTLGSYANIYARAYGPDTSTTSWRNKLLMWGSSYYSAPGKPVIHAWAFATNDLGLNINTGCNKLHLIGLTLYFTYFVPPSSTNPSGYVRSQPFVTPWVRGLSSLRVVTQAGWTDSKVSKLRLSQAHEVILPLDPPPPAPLRTALYKTPTSPVRGPDTSYILNPVVRYGQ